jgi:hypothetical protein
MAVPIEWRKSSFSGADSNCVEIGWRKSSFSGPDANCVEVAHTAQEVAIRDSKDPEGPHLVLSSRNFLEFIAACRH